MANSQNGMSSSVISGPPAAAAFALAGSAQQHHLAADDLRAILLLPGILVVPGVGADTAFDVNGAALFEIFPCYLRLAVEEYDIVPLGANRPVAALVLDAIVVGQGK